MAIGARPRGHLLDVGWRLRCRKKDAAVFETHEHAWHLASRIVCLDDLGLLVRIEFLFCLAQLLLKVLLSRFVDLQSFCHFGLFHVQLPVLRANQLQFKSDHLRLFNHDYRSSFRAGWHAVPQVRSHLSLAVVSGEVWLLNRLVPVLHRVQVFYFVSQAPFLLRQVLVLHASTPLPDLCEAKLRNLGLILVSAGSVLTGWREEPRQKVLANDVRLRLFLDGLALASEVADVGHVRRLLYVLDGHVNVWLVGASHDEAHFVVGLINELRCDKLIEGSSGQWAMIIVVLLRLSRWHIGDVAVIDHQSERGVALPALRGILVVAFTGRLGTQIGEQVIRKIHSDQVLVT